MTEATTQPSFRIIGGDGREYGPIDLATARQWGRDGRLAADSQIWDSRSGKWQPAAVIPELACVISSTASSFSSASDNSEPTHRHRRRRRRPRNSHARVSFGLALGGFVCMAAGLSLVLFYNTPIVTWLCLPILTILATPATVYGFIALAQIRLYHDRGLGYAIMGILMGFIELAAAVIWFVLRLYVS